MDLAEQHQLCSEDPEAFWGKAGLLIDWSQPPTQAAPDPAAGGGWYPGGRLNTCYNALDRHVKAGHGDRPAVVFESGITGASQILRYADLRAKVQECAAVLQRLGVQAGDRVLVFMPTIPEVIVGMLACARIGAIHSVVFGGFAAPELAARIDDAEPKVLLTASCGLEPGRLIDYMQLVNDALALVAHPVSAVLVKQRPEQNATLVAGRDYDWDQELTSHAGAQVPCVDRSSTDRSTSSTPPARLAAPKASSATTAGTPLPSPGRWPISSTSEPATSGGPPPTSGGSWAIPTSSTHRCSSAPRLSSTKASQSAHQTLASGGASARSTMSAACSLPHRHPRPQTRRRDRATRPRLSPLQPPVPLRCRRTHRPETASWARRTLKVPVVDNWWQTETGWPITVTAPAEDADAAGPTAGGQPSPGYQVAVLDTSGERLPAGQEGSICLRLPLPPGAATAIWSDQERYASEYLSTFAGYYLTGDGGFLDADGRVHVLGRTDDVINVAGHRLSTGALEAIVAAHPAVAECAVIGKADPLKGQTPQAIVVLKDGHETEADAVAREIVDLVRAEFGAVAALRQVQVASALPKTRSGKLLRRTMRDLAEGRPAVIPGTIEDPSVVESLRTELESAQEPVER